MSSFVHIAARPLHSRVPLTHLAIAVRCLKWLERGTITAVAICVTMVIIQALYPQTHTLPFLYRDLSLNGLTAQQLAPKLASFNIRTYKVTTTHDTYTFTAPEVGATVDIEAAQRSLLSYSWKKRLTPFSFFSSAKAGLPLHKTPERQEIIKRLAEANNYAPKDAAITKNADNSYTITPSARGSYVSPGDIELALDALAPDKAGEITIPTTVIEPTLSDFAAADAIEKVEASQKLRVTTSYNGATYAVPADKLAAWATISVGAQKKFVVSYDVPAIKSWLSASLPPIIGISHNTVGSDAQVNEVIDLDLTATRLANAIDDTDVEITASLKQIAASDGVLGRYSATDQGITALINDWLHDYPSLKASVAFQELSGEARQAAVNGDKQLPTASVYKLYLAAYLYKQIEAGNISPTTGVINGKNITQCIEAMMVNSDNACGEQLGYQIGWTTLTNYVKSLGLSATKLNVTPPTSTASDTVKFMQQLENGTLISRTNTDTLLGYMGRQIYRKGIPAGSVGSTVQDKIGYGSGIWNDAALVRGANSSYILSIYTSSSSPDALRDLANRIHTLLNN